MSLKTCIINVWFIHPETNPPPDTSIFGDIGWSSIVNCEHACRARWDSQENHHWGTGKYFWQIIWLVSRRSISGIKYIVLRIDREDQFLV